MNMQRELERLSSRLQRLKPVKLKHNFWSWDLGAEWSFSDEDLTATLVRHEGTPLLFGRYTAEQVMDDMEESGLLEGLRQRGYAAFRPELAGPTVFSDSFRLFARHREVDGEQLLMDVRTHRGVLAGECPVSGRNFRIHALVWDWIELQDPLAKFDRPPLPGQAHPGLGMFHEATDLMRRQVGGMDIDAVVAVPEYFHNAWLYSREFRFFDPEREGRFRAMVRDLLDGNLAEASRALDEGRVLEGDQVVKWVPSEQVLPLRDWLRDYFREPAYETACAEAQAAHRYRLAEPAA